MNYEHDIRIDETALDVEWLEQASLMMRYTKYMAQCAMSVDQAKEKLDVVKAELDFKIRSNPEEHGISKITEAVVFNTILLSQEYKDANAELLQAKYEYDIAKAAVSAMHARKDALENLVKLHGMQYFAGPRIPRDLSEERSIKEAQQKTVDSRVSITLKRKK